MIGMIAMIGLAVDGGGVYFLNRDLQNAVDAAVIAATYAKCTGGDIDFAATQAIADNGFTTGGPDNVMITVNNPPATGPGAGKDEYVEVIVQADKPSYFIQVVRGNAPLTVAARGVGHCKESETNGAGRAVFGACDAGGDAVKIKGSNTCSAEIIGGIHSESGGSSGPGTCVPSGDVTSGNDTSGYKGNIPGGPKVESHPNYPVFFDIGDYDEPTDPIPQAYINTFGPDAYWVVPNGMKTLQADHLVIPGTNPGDAARLIYVPPSVTDLSIKKGSITSGTIYVTIVSHDSLEFTGDLDNFEFINGGEHPGFAGTNPSEYLFAFSIKGSQGGCSGGGSGERGIKFSANASTWRGIIYAPNGTVEMSLSSNTASYGAIFGWTVDLQGSSIKITYDPDMIPPDPPTIGIAE